MSIFQTTKSLKALCFQIYLDAHYRFQFPYFFKVYIGPRSHQVRAKTSAPKCTSTFRFFFFGLLLKIVETFAVAGH